MPRIPFGEKLKSRQINIDFEIQKLHNIFDTEFYNDGELLFEYLDNKMGCFDFEEFMNLLYENLNLSDPIARYLDYCDFFLLFLEPLRKFKSKPNPYEKIQTDFETILDGIVFILDRIDYQILINDNNKLLIMLKDTVAEEVAGSLVYADIKWRVLEYNAHNTELKDKKAIISELYKKFEEIRPNLKQTNREIETRLGELIQLVRHKKDERKQEKYAFYYNDEEKWCDKIYDLLLECFLHEDNKRTLSEINKLQGD